MTRLIQLEYPEHHVFLNMWRFSSTRWLILSGGNDIQAKEYGKTIDSGLDRISGPSDTVSIQK